MPIAEAPGDCGPLLRREDLAEILRHAWDPHVCVTEVIERLENAPALAAEVRRVADSSLYDMQGRISSLKRVALIVGLGAVAEISAALWVRDRLEGDRWAHQVEVAVAARLIAEHLDPGLRMPAWVAGLLHGSDAAALRPQVASENALSAVVSAAHLLAPDPCCEAWTAAETVLDDLRLLPEDVTGMRARTEIRSKEALRIFAG